MSGTILDLVTIHSVQPSGAKTLTPLVRRADRGQTGNSGAHSLASDSVQVSGLATVSSTAGRVLTALPSPGVALLQHGHSVLNPSWREELQADLNRGRVVQAQIEESLGRAMADEVLTGQPQRAVGIARRDVEMFRQSNAKLQAELQRLGPEGDQRARPGTDRVAAGFSVLAGSMHVLHAYNAFSAHKPVLGAIQSTAAAGHLLFAASTLSERLAGAGKFGLAVGVTAAIAGIFVNR